MKLERKKCINGAAFQWPRAPPTLEKEQRTKNLLWTLGERQNSRLYYERKGGRGHSGCHNKELMQVLI
jgi:hypothetical protein